MIINIIKLIPKEWNYQIKNNFVEISYKAKKGNNPKTIKFPREIIIDEKFMEGLGLFLGDGDLNRKDKGHLGFASKDKDIAKHALNFLINKFNLQIIDTTVTIQYNNKNKNMEKEWSTFLEIPKNRIFKRFSNRHKHECAQIQVNSIIFRKIFEFVINKALSNIYLTNEKLRRGLIRGLFAAEGNLGIDYLSNKDYISQIDFNLNIKENHIEKMIADVLNKEKIHFSVNNNEKDNSKVIRICNWKNYKKLWEIKLFDLCERKRDKFINILNNLSVYCFVEENFLKKLFKKQNLKQKELAKLLKSWQPNISRMMRGQHQLLMERFHLLNKKINKRDYFDKIYKIRIGSLTYLENNNENKGFIKYIYDFKGNNLKNFH